MTLRLPLKSTTDLLSKALIEKRSSVDVLSYQDSKTLSSSRRSRAPWTLSETNQPDGGINIAVLPFRRSDRPFHLRYST